MERADEEPTRVQRTRARWRKLRAATLVFLLFRRRVHHGTAASRRQQKRMPTSVFFAKPSVQAATAAVAQRLAAKAPPAAASPQVTRWFAQRMELFERLTRKPIQSRDDVDIKLLGEFIRQTRFFHGLTSASIDALAQAIRFRTCHEGEVLHLQGSDVLDTSGRYLVVSGSLLVYKNAQFALRAREGDDYIEWFLTNMPGATRETVRYGECIETCSSGDIAGDDATLGHLFREHSVISQVKTVIAYVTQADFKRVIRFNVENESQLLGAVREILTPMKTMKQSTPHVIVKDPAQVGPSARPDLSRQQIRVLMRFLARFKCFRILPYQFCGDIISKLQLTVVKSDEIICLAGDAQPSMTMVLDGKLCIHVQETFESLQLAASRDRLDHARPRTVLKPSTPLHPEPTEYLPGCEAGSTVESAIGKGSLHICSLTAGDSFGELAISSVDSQIQGAFIYHPFTSSGQMSCTIVRVSRHDYQTALQRYVDSTDFNLPTVCSILAQSLPQDRTDEQVQYMKAFLLLRSSAKLFFGQLPSRVLDGLLLHAGILSQDIGEDIEDFIQREGSVVETMKVVLNGYVGVFRCSGTAPNESASLVDQSEQIIPKKAVLRRYQSRLIRANTHILDTSGVQPSGRRASIHKHTLALPKSVIPDPLEAHKQDAGTVDPVSVLPSGAAFGHLQILTGQTKSPYSYAAFACGSGVFDDTNSPVSDSKQSVHLLSIPARFVHLYLSDLDGQIIYNPTRAFKRLQHENIAKLAGEHVDSSNVRRFQLSSILRHSTAFAGLPKKTASSMIDEMEVLLVEPRRVVYEVGEPIRPALFVILNGSVRAFNYVSKPKAGRDRRGSFFVTTDEKRAKLPRRVSQDTPDSRQDDSACNGEFQHYFSKPASDAIFLSDYSQTTELVCGDSFGRSEHHSFTNRVRQSSNGPSASLRLNRPQEVYTENVVSMTECLLGVVTHREYQCELPADERRLLLRIIDERDEIDRSGVRCIDEDGEAGSSAFNSLATSFHVLDAMGLSYRVPTQDRVHLAHKLKYLKLDPGEIVFKQGEVSEAVYFIVFGSVTLCMKRRTDSGADPRSRGFTLPDFGNPVIDLAAGEVFGEEALESSHGCTRLCTAIASVEEHHGTTLVYLSQSDFELVLNKKSKPAIPGFHRQAESRSETAIRLLGLGQRAISPRERWKMAIYQVIQLRAQRSQWPTVLTKARNHRIDLLLDLIKDLPVFEGVSKSAAKKLCCNAVLQTVSQDTTIYNKSDALVDTCYLVVQGSVTLYQTYYGSSALNTSAAAVPVGVNPPNDTTSVRVTIQVLEPGDIFGEFEMMEEHPRRHINAVVAAAGTKIAVIQQEDYFAFWPQRERLKQKLRMLKNQLRNLCRLDPDQMCSLYYSMKERTFRRNEVIIGNKDEAGYLHVIQDGMCVVHDAVVLKQKKSTAPNRSVAKLSLDTRVSTIGPGAILFSERPDVAPQTDNRQASSRSLDSVEITVPVETPNNSQYVVVDTPIVTTFSVELFPKRVVSMQRQTDVLAVLLLGKNGLRVIRDTVEVQLQWRAGSVAQTGRLVADSFSQSADRVSEFAKNGDEMESDFRARMTKPAVQKDISKALLRYDPVASTASKHLVESPRKPTSSNLHQISTISLLSPRKTASIGSFTATVKPQTNLWAVRERVASPPLLPSLASCASAAYDSYTQSPRSPRNNSPPNRSIDRDEQLRKEERVLFSLPKPVAPQDEITKQQQQQMRRRHGRPLPKRVENSIKFVDEHAIISSTQLRGEHERKKAGLCRRLLHVKGSTQQ